MSLIRSYSKISVYVICQAVYDHFDIRIKKKKLFQSGSGFILIRNDHFDIRIKKKNQSGSGFILIRNKHQQFAGVHTYHNVVIGMTN